VFVKNLVLRIQYQSIMHQPVNGIHPCSSHAQLCLGLANSSLILKHDFTGMWDGGGVHLETVVQ